MQYPYIDISYLLKKTFGTFRAIYLPLIIIGLPPATLYVLVVLSPEPSTQYYWLNWFFIMLINPWLFAIRYLYIYKYLIGTKISLLQTFTTGIKKFISLAILSFITISPLLLIIDSLKLKIELLILLVLPLIYIYIRTYFSYQIVLIENTSPFQAITRSWQLTKGFFWLIIRTTFTFLIVIFLLIFLLKISIQSILNLIPITYLNQPDILSNIVVNFTTQTLSSIFNVLLYMEFQKIKTIDISKK